MVPETGLGPMVFDFSLTFFFPRKVIDLKEVKKGARGKKERTDGERRDGGATDKRNVRQGENKEEVLRLEQGLNGREERRKLRTKEKF